MGKKRYPQPGSLLKYTGGCIGLAYDLHNALKHGDKDVTRFLLTDPITTGFRKRNIY